MVNVEKFTIDPVVIGKERTRAVKTSTHAVFIWRFFTFLLFDMISVLERCNQSH